MTPGARELQSARQDAQAEVARLERAQVRATEPDARRILSDARVALMAAVQRRTDGASLRVAIDEARQWRERWEVTA